MSTQLIRGGVRGAQCARPCAGPAPRFRGRGPWRSELSRSPAVELTLVSFRALWFILVKRKETPRFPSAESSYVSPKDRLDLDFIWSVTACVVSTVHISGLDWCALLVTVPTSSRLKAP